MSKRTGGGRHAAAASGAGRVAPVHALLAALMAALLLGSFPGGQTVSAADSDAARFVSWSRPDTPALSLKDPNGRTHTLDDYRGKVVLLNFWATWCEPCKDEMPSMVKLKQSLAGRPFEILAVNFGESPSRVREFLARERLDLVALLDPNKDATRAWRVRVLPASFLVGPDGRVRYSVLGELDWSADTAVRTVQGLLPPR
jgi:thiol-disulfide isomerase/thioredoxin